MRLVNEEVIIDLYTNIYVCSKVKCDPLNVKCRKSGSTYWCNWWSYTHYTPTSPHLLYTGNALEDVKIINDTDNTQLWEWNREKEPVPMILKYENEKWK